MREYVKKPVIVKAIQLTKDNIQEIHTILFGEPATTSHKWEAYCDLVMQYGFHTDFGKLKPNAWLVLDGAEYQLINDYDFIDNYEPHMG
jgi:hypothetical protein